MLTCSIVLWGGRNTANKYHWRVWGVLAVSGPHWVCCCSQVCVLSLSMLLSHQVALQRNCLKWALGCVHFPGLSHSDSGSWVLHKRTDSVGPAFCVLPRSEQLRQPGAWRAHSPQVWCILSPPCQPLEFLGGSRRALSGVLCFFWGAHLWLQPSQWMSTVRESQEVLVSYQKPACSLVEDAISEAKFAPFQLWLLPVSLPPGMDQSPASQLSSGIRSVLCSVSGPGSALSQGFSGDNPLSLFFIPCLWLSHSLGCYLTLAPSDCPQGIQAQSLP